MEVYQSTVFDQKTKITEGKHGRQLMEKHHDNFDVVFADKHIQLSAKWRVDLVNSFDENNEMYLFHAGHPFSKEPVEIGPLHLHNDLDMEYGDKLNKLYSITQEAGTGEILSNVISYILYSVASEWVESPLCHFFDQISDKYENRLSAEGLVLRDEDDILEFKGRDWFAVEDDSKLAEKLTKEIQAETRLVIGGINEDEQKIQPLNRGEWKPERNDRIQEAVRKQNGNHDSITIRPMPLTSGDCLLFAFTVRESDSGADLSLLT
jgi:hypothetical protein